jgi:hypothetical protein
MTKPKIKKPAVPATPATEAPATETPEATPRPFTKKELAAMEKASKAQQASDANKPTSKLLAYRAWKKAPKSATPETLYKATGCVVKQTTCAAWISFWKRNLNLPKEARAEAKAAATPKKPKGKKVQEVENG